MKKAFLALLGAVIIAQSFSITAAAANNDSSIMQNDYLTLYVGKEDHNLGLYQLSANKGDLANAGDDKKNLMYDNFYSSYTTIVLNGKTYRFGEGETVSAPCYDPESDSCITVQSFGSLEVTQTLSFADGMDTGHDDMLLVSYTVKNTSDNDVLAGVRIMLDSQLDRDDKGTLRVDGALLDFEKDYENDIPSVWSVVSGDDSVAAYGKVRTVPDSIEFADWSSLFDKKWGYSADGAKDIEDSAAALVWDNSTLAPGSSNEYSVYYGVKNLSDDPSVHGVVIEPEDDTPDPGTRPDPATDTVVEASASATTADSSDQTSDIVSGNDQPTQDAPLTGENGIFVAAFGAAVTLALGAAVVFGIRRKGGSRNEK